MKVGEYVRTDKGIAKYLGLGRDVLKHETNKNVYEHYYNQHLFDNYIFNVGHDYGDTLTYDEFNNIDKLGKVKETITDLIEIGDYVNGEQVSRIKQCPEYHLGDGILIFNEHNETIYSNFRTSKYYDIKSIITHEQFSQMEYKVNEND